MTDLTVVKVNVNLTLLPKSQLVYVSQVILDLTVNQVSDRGVKYRL